MVAPISPLQLLLAALHARCAPAYATGSQLYQQLETQRLLPTGCAAIDVGLLAGGVREGHLLEVYGESAAGKTQVGKRIGLGVCVRVACRRVCGWVVIHPLMHPPNTQNHAQTPPRKRTQAHTNHPVQLCLSAAAQTAARGERVLFIDTNNAFSAARLLALLKGLGPAGRSVASGCYIVASNVLPEFSAVRCAGQTSHIVASNFPTSFPCISRACWWLQSLEAALDCIQLLRVYSVHALLGVLDALLRDAQHARAQTRRGGNGGMGGGGGGGEDGWSGVELALPPLPRMIIIDSLSALITPVRLALLIIGAHSNVNPWHTSACPALPLLPASATTRAHLD